MYHLKEIDKTMGMIEVGEDITKAEIKKEKWRVKQIKKMERKKKEKQKNQQDTIDR